MMHKLQAGLESRMTIRGQKSDAALLQQSACCLEADAVPTRVSPTVATLKKDKQKLRLLASV